ncbi:hypothetical protein [Burkholderia gladioli]|uniref:hypothetical protein n=1 Tax=Burkholderia gladioli TaxID=28095 RepID=UPI0016415FD2|nr:hypothetical protein [Burkholderia gladioli]
MDEPNQAPSAEITQVVADSNAATVASLSTSISGPEANAGAVSASADLVPLSTIVSTAQESPAALGELMADAGSAATATLASSAGVSGAAGTAAGEAQGAGGAAAGEQSGVPVADASTPENVTVNQAASPSPISTGEILGSANAPAVAQSGESAGSRPDTAVTVLESSGEAPASGTAAAPLESSGSRAIPSADSASSTSSSSSATTMLSTAVAPDTSSTAAQPDPTTVALSSATADATLADAGGIPAASPAAVPPETLLARLHADLEALERKIELGIHVFAHEVAAIRDQVKSLI